MVRENKQNKVTRKTAQSHRRTLCRFAYDRKSDQLTLFGPFGDKGKKLIKCRRKPRRIQIGYGQVSAKMFGKGTDTDVEWNIMKQKFWKYGDPKALFYHFDRCIVLIDPESYGRRDMS